MSSVPFRVVDGQVTGYSWWRDFDFMFMLVLAEVLGLLIMWRGTMYQPPPPMRMLVGVHLLWAFVLVPLFFRSMYRDRLGKIRKAWDDRQKEKASQ